MELPNGIKILTMVKRTGREDNYVWRAVNDYDEGKPANKPDKYSHVVDDINGTHIYAVLAWPFETKMKAIKNNLGQTARAELTARLGRAPSNEELNAFEYDNNVVPNINFSPNRHMRLHSQGERGDYLARANENKLEIMTTPPINEINASIQLPVKFFSRWNDVINYINRQGYLELFANNVHSELLNLAGGRRRTRRGRRKKRTRRRRKSRRKSKGRKRRKSRRKRKR